VRQNSGRVISGTKEQVKEQLIRLTDEFGVDEVIVSCMSDNAEDRFNSFKLLAEAFELNAGPELPEING
jgi:alkanesulfonate monooxygenase SsuD/methylene tetrahydromethanopterin reductase-like flavin-dependent oxidoreductase (luciferase family)